MFSLLFLPLAHAMTGSAWATATTRLHLGLLPCTLDDTLLPGERRDVFVFEERHCACIAKAAAGDGCLGLLYLDEDDGHPTEFSSLVEVESFREEEDLGTWARLRCVGRCLLKDVSTSEDGFYSAQVDVYADTDAGFSEAAAISKLRELHASTTALRKELTALLDSYDFGPEPMSKYIHVSPHRRDAPFGIFSGADDGYIDEDEEDEEDDEDAEYVFVGLDFERPTTFGTTYFFARDHSDLDDEESVSSLDELVKRRRTVLTDNGSESPPLLLDTVRDVWRVDTEADAESQLLSLSAVGCLGPPERAEALIMRSTRERLDYATAALIAYRSHLTAMLRMAHSEALM